MTYLENHEAVLKMDACGRIRTPRERREQLLEEYERSGMSARQFAKLAGVKTKTFSAWSLERRKQTRGPVPVPAGPAKSVTLLEAVVEERRPSLASGEQRMVVELHGGAKIEVRNREQLRLVAELLGLLSERTSQPALGC